MKACTYCGRENSEESLQCQSCGTEIEADQARPPKDRRSTSERQQENLRNIAQKQRARRCPCGASMRAVGARGVFLSGSVETISAAAIYECPACRRTVEIPSVCTFVTYGLFSLTFLWCGLQFVDWQGRAGVTGSALRFMIIASPGILILWFVLKGWRRRRNHPPVS